MRAVANLLALLLGGLAVVNVKFGYTVAAVICIASLCICGLIRLSAASRD